MVGIDPLYWDQMTSQSSVVSTLTCTQKLQHIKI